MFQLFVLPRQIGAGKHGVGKGVTKDVKPPDLWIHHDQMELKSHEKSQNQEPAMMLTPIVRNSKDFNSDNDSQMSTLDRRGNTTYIGNIISAIGALLFYFESQSKDNATS